MRFSRLWMIVPSQPSRAGQLNDGRRHDALRRHAIHHHAIHHHDGDGGNAETYGNDGNRPARPTRAYSNRATRGRRRVRRKRALRRRSARPVPCRLSGQPAGRPMRGQRTRACPRHGQPRSQRQARERGPSRVASNRDGLRSAREPRREPSRGPHRSVARQICFLK